MFLAAAIRDFRRGWVEGGRATPQRGELRVRLAENDAAALANLPRDFTPPRPSATAAFFTALQANAMSLLRQASFAFCFDPKEGVLMLGGLQLLSACFWLSVYGAAPEDTWEIGDSLRWITIVLLYVNAAISLAAVRRNSDGLALTLIFTFFLLLLLLAIEFGGSHPASCDPPQTSIDDPPNKPLGTVMSKLLWTSDACVLMTILGWVTLAAGAVIGLYLQYMLLCFWVGVRASREDVRRVLRVIAALPMRRYTKPVKRASAAAAAASSSATSTDNTACGGDCSSATTPTPPPQHPEEEQRQRSIAAAAASEEEPESCSICLGEFEEGEEVHETRRCMHANPLHPPFFCSHWHHPSSPLVLVALVYTHTGAPPPLHARVL